MSSLVNRRILSPRAPQDSVPLDVVGSGRGVDATVHLNDEPRGAAKEVHNEPVDHLLPPKMEVTQPMSPESFPKQPLLIGLVSAQLAGA